MGQIDLPKEGASFTLTHVLITFLKTNSLKRVFTKVRLSLVMLSLKSTILGKIPNILR